MPLSEAPIQGRTNEQEMILASLKRSRIPGTMLVTGAAGVGKRRFALWMAQALLCRSGQKRPCDTCHDCKLAKSLSHPDLHVYLPHASVGAGNPDAQIQKVETSREELLSAMRSSALYPPSAHGLAYYSATVRAIAEKSAGKAYHESGRKVFILADAERMANAPVAQNALLKLLEEPPVGTHFILTTDAPHLLLDTIRSRTTELSLPPLSAEEVTQILVSAGISEEEAERAARYGAGSVTRARQWLDPEWQAEREAALGMLRAAFSSDAGERIAQVAATGHSGASGDFSARLAHLRRLAYDGASLASGKSDPSIDERLREMLSSMTEEKRPSLAGWTLALEAISEASSGARANGSPQLLTHRLLRGLHQALACHPPERITDRRRRQDRVDGLLSAQTARLPSI